MSENNITFRFNITSEVIWEFLTDVLDMPIDSLADGMLTQEELLDRGIIPSNLERANIGLPNTMCDYDTCCSAYIDITPWTAVAAIQYDRDYNSGILTQLFATPEDQITPTEQTVLYNIFHVNNMAGLILNPSESILPYELSASYFGEYLLNGLHYAETMVPEHIAKAGQSVVKITGGTGVVVSKEGHVLTARHILFAESFRGPGLVRFMPGRSVENGENEIPITKEAVIWGGVTNSSIKFQDLILLELPELAGHPFADLADQTTSNGERVWAVGYPDLNTNLHDNTDHGNNNKRFTAGQINCDENCFTRRVVQHSANAGPGYSGGALFNDDGELIGINSIHSIPLDYDAVYYCEAESVAALAYPPIGINYDYDTQIGKLRAALKLIR